MGDGTMEPGRGRRRMAWIACAPLLTVLILLAVYALRGITPFGELTVVQGDVEQQYTAMYTQFRDVMTGAQSPLFSWNTALGREQCVDNMVFTFLSPLNLLFLLVPRSGLIAFLSWFVAIKLALCALSFSWYAAKRFPTLSPCWIVFFGVAYGLSGYTLIQYHNTIWLEAVMLLPLAAYAAERLIRTGRGTAYTLLLAALLVMNFYTAAMICVFLFLVGGAYILLMTQRQAQGRAVVRLALCTAAAFALSAAATLPAGIQLTRAARLGYSGVEVLQAYTEYSYARGFALITSGFALALLPKWGLRLWKTGRRKTAVFAATTLGLYLLPLWFDGIDKVLHFGGNIGFPYRYGYLTVFLALAFCCAAVAERESTPANDRLCWRRGAGLTLTLCTGAVVAVFALLMLRDGRKAADFLDWKNGMLAIFTAVTVLAYLLALRLPARRLARGVCMAVLLMQCFAYGYSCFPGERNGETLTGVSSADAAAIGAALPKTGWLDRVKNDDATLTLNYAKFAGVPTLSSFSSSNQQVLLDTVQQWGYGIGAYSIQDCGGTLLTDALLHMRYLVTKSDRYDTDAAFTRIGQARDYALYQYENTLPFGLVGSAELKDVDAAAYDHTFAFQNALFAALSGSTEPLFAVTPAQTLQTAVEGEGEAAVREFTVTVEKRQRLYLLDPVHLDARMHVQVLVDGVAVWETDEHPRTYRSGPYDLGEYENTTVVIRVTGMEEERATALLLGGMDAALFEQFVRQAGDAGADRAPQAGKRTLSLTAAAQRDGDVLFLPVQYSDGWRCRVDGTSTEILRITGDMIGIELPQGEHTVTLVCTPVGTWAGVVITVFGAAAVIGLWQWRRKRGTLLPAAPGWLDGISLWVLRIGWCGAVLCVFIVPAAYALLAFYMQLR